MSQLASESLLLLPHNYSQSNRIYSTRKSHLSCQTSPSYVLFSLVIKKKSSCLWNIILAFYFHMFLLKSKRKPMHRSKEIPFLFVFSIATVRYIENFKIVKIHLYQNIFILLPEYADAADIVKINSMPLYHWSWICMIGETSRGRIMQLL